MHDYKLMKEDNTTLLFNSCFVDDEDIEYAYKHRFNILYTETSCCDTFKLIKKLMDLGYTLEVIEKEQFSFDGRIKLNPILYAKFIHPDMSNNVYKIDDKERLIITEILNYLICLSRLVSPHNATRYYGFEFDGAYIDLFRTIKNDFQHNMLNPKKILEDKIYKNMINELDNMECGIDE